MKINKEWNDYSVIATGNGYKLENFNGVVLLRPDPQIIWEEPFCLREYKGLNAIYERSEKGGGNWTILKPVPDEFFVRWKDLKFSLKLMGFKHTGVFPEQAVNWEIMQQYIAAAKRPIKVLNLFAYTGGATIACAAKGAEVTHVDAAKAMCEKAGQNAKLSNLQNKPIRYIIDDCVKFVEKEIRRGKFYDAIIMDPPSYGRGPNGEMWKLEEEIFRLVKLTKSVMSSSPLFYLINSYTTGLQPTVMANILQLVFGEYNPKIEGYEIGLETEQNKIILPCGCSAMAKF